MRLSEESHYEHEDHGPVKLIFVDGETVGFESLEKEHIMGDVKIPKGWKESVIDFIERAEPLDITIDTPTSSPDSQVNDISSV